VQQFGSIYKRSDQNVAAFVCYYTYLTFSATLQSLSEISVLCFRASYNDKKEHQLDAANKYTFHL
jgi:hypothetical protein